jgi:hypothetical protein
MAALSRSAAAFRLFADDLSPTEVTALLGGEPTKSAVKGGNTPPNAGGRIFVARTGSWVREVEGREPADGDAHIAALLEDLTTDMEVWQALAARFRVDLSSGVF